MRLAGVRGIGEMHLESPNSNDLNMNSDTQKPWWALQLEVKHLETALSELAVLLPNGYQEIGPNRLLCYVQRDDAELGAFKDQLSALGATLIETAPLEEVNWVQQCQAVWAPLVLSKMRIVPVQDQNIEIAPDQSRHTVRIIPGLGFGTGHHASTAMLLEFIDEYSQTTSAPLRILDVGTGSGILALGCAVLFPCHVDACDNDPLAVENAQANVAMNGMADQITLWCGTSESATGPYDLVIANIYAEVLQELEPLFRTLVKESGTLMLSGVMNSRVAGVQSAYRKEFWLPVKQRSREGWHALQYMNNSRSLR